MERQIEMSPFELDITEHQAARHATPAHDILTASIGCHGVIQPIRIRLPKKVLAGAGRVIAGRKLNLAKVPCIVTESDPEKDGLVTASENNARTDFTTLERVDQAKAAADRFPSMSQKELARGLAESETDICRLLKISTCAVTYGALKEGKLTGVSEAYAVVQAPVEARAGLIALRVSGAKRDELATAGRRTRKAPAPADAAERTAKIKIPLALKVDGVTVSGTVTVAGSSGEELDLPEAERILAQALRSVKDAQKLGLGPKAAQASWKDMAAKSKTP